MDAFLACAVGSRARNSAVSLAVVEAGSGPRADRGQAGHDAMGDVAQRRHVDGGAGRGVGVEVGAAQLEEGRPEIGCGASRVSAASASPVVSLSSSVHAPAATWLTLKGMPSMRVPAGIARHDDIADRRRRQPTASVMTHGLALVALTMLPEVGLHVVADHDDRALRR